MVILFSCKLCFCIVRYNIIYVPMKNRFARIGTRFSSELGVDDPLGGFIFFVRVWLQKPTLIRRCSVFERKPAMKIGNRNVVVIIKRNRVSYFICILLLLLWYAYLCNRAEQSNMCLNSWLPTRVVPGPFLNNDPVNHSGIVPI